MTPIEGADLLLGGGALVVILVFCLSEDWEDCGFNNLDNDAVAQVLETMIWF
jgi:hypothetical protein